MPYRLVLGILWGVLALGTDLLALDTLRVGNNGNVSWAGQTFGSVVQPLPAEYKVSRFFTEIGNVPGKRHRPVQPSGGKPPSAGQDPHPSTARTPLRRASPSRRKITRRDLVRTGDDGGYAFPARGTLPDSH